MRYGCLLVMAFYAFSCHVILSVSIALLMACGPVFAQPVPPGSDCGSAGQWTLPSASEEGKLVQVQTIIRHGDRTPWSGDFCWPDDSSVWSCYLTSGEIPVHSNNEFGQVVPRLYRKKYSIRNEPLHGNCSVGQLTYIGFIQQLSNGKVIRDGYIGKGLLSDQINSEEIYVRSDDVPRTLQSAESFLLGMYPPQEDTSTEVVWIHTMDLEYEYMTANPTLCPMFGNYSENFRKSKTWTDHSPVTEKLLEDIKSSTNFSVDLDDFDHFADCLRTHYCHSLPWPKGMTYDLYNQTWTEFAWQFYNSFKYPSISENAQVGIGFLLKELWQNMNAVVSGKPNPKFLLYSGHDTTLIPLLVALQADDGVWPSYASMIILELYSTTSDYQDTVYGSNYFVRVIYNGKVLYLPFCGSQKDTCDFDVFSKYIKTVIPDDKTKQCGTPKQLQKWKWY